MATLGSGTTTLPLSAPLAALTPNVTYHFRVAATNDYGLVYGSDQNFTTLGLAQVSTLAATAVSTNSATLNGSINPNGWPTTAWFQWGATSSYGNVTSETALGSGTTDLPLSAPLAGLTPGVTYHFRIAATNDCGLAYGSDQSFTAATSPTEFTYTTNNGTITITGYTGAGGVVTIPGTLNGLPVTSIGNSAFAYCFNLSDVAIPGSVRNIGDYAFSSDWALTNVTIGNAVISIGDYAFKDTGLINVTIPEGVTNIGHQALLEGSLTAIYVNTNNPSYSSLDGVLFNKRQTTLIQFPILKLGPACDLPCPGTGSYTVPNSVTNIGNDAFYGCWQLTNVVCPHGLIWIGDYGFASCYNLSSMTIPDTVTQIGDYAFTDNISLTGIYFWGNAPALTGGNTFFGDRGASVYYLPNTTGWRTTFGGLPTALWQPGAPEASTLSASSITTNSATLNATVNPDGYPTSAWFQWGTTTNYGDLTPVAALGSGTTALPLSAPLAGLAPNITYHFRVAATNANGVVYGSDQSFTTPAQSGGAGWTLNGGATMTGNTITLTVGAGNTSRSAFLNNPQDVTAFHIVFFYQDVSGAGSADGVTFCIQNDPRGATALGGGNGGSSLGYQNITPSVALAMNIYAGNGRGVALFQNGAVTYGYASLLPDVDIGGNTDLIQVNVDYDGTVMTVTFKDTVSGGIASTNWTVNIPSVVGGSTAYVGFTGADGGVASIQTITWGNSSPTTLISTLPATGVSTNSAILNGTVNPNDSPTTAWFEWGTTPGYGNLTSVADLGSGTNALPLSASLAGLSPSVTYHFRVAATNDNGLVYGGDQSFTTLGPPQVSTLPATAVSTGSATLNGTVNPNAWPTTASFQWGTSINYGSLTSVADLGSGTAAVPLSAPLAGLTPGVTYHFRVAATNDYGLAYGSDQSFTTATLPSEFNYTINNGTVAITGYTGPGGAVTIPDWINGLPVTSIGYNAFTDCTRLTNLTIPNSLTSIGRQAFWHCTNLASISVDGLNSTYSSVNGVLFNKTQTTLVQYPPGIAATSYTIPDSVTSIGEGAFEFGARLTNVLIPNGVTSIGDYAFWACNSLTDPTIPNSVTNIGDSAFAECASLTSITIPNRVTRIGVGTFSDCTRLTSLTIPDSVTTIGTNAFFDCTGLTNVTIGSGVTDIRLFAFYECTNLTALHFEGDAPSLGGYVFQDDDRATVYYLPGTTGWGTTFGGLPTALWTQVPTLQASPQSQTAEAGLAVSLRVQASSPLPLFYYWYLNATNLLSSGTTWQLELTNLQWSQSGAYTVVISNVLGAITGAPALLNVIAAVEHRPVPGVKATGEAGSLLNVDYADSLSPAPIWTPLGSVSLTSTSQFYFDLTLPLPAQRFYRAWQTGTPGVMPSLDLHLVPAITLTGTIGHSVRVDAINQVGPIDAWFTLDTVTLTNTTQLYFDTSALQQPERLYRLVQVP